MPLFKAGKRFRKLSFRKFLRSNWKGSENAYTASLLSSIPEYHGEARGYLRAAENWLRLYFEEREKEEQEKKEQEKKDRYYHEELLRDEDMAELAFTHYN